jgi:hypothetical protein
MKFGTIWCPNKISTNSGVQVKFGVYLPVNPVWFSYGSHQVKKFSAV